MFFIVLLNLSNILVLGTKKKSNRKKIDLVFLLLFPIASALVSLLIKANLLTSTLLFFGLPSVFLTFRAKKSIKKAAIFSLIAIPFVTVLDYMAHLNETWLVPSTVFPFRLLGLIPIENYIWVYLIFYVTILFYEYFLDKGRDYPIKKRALNLFVLLLIALMVFLIILYAYPLALQVSYFYLKAGALVILLPSLTFLTFFPKLISRFFTAGAYFFSLAFIFELTALKLNQWSFTGTNFIGWVEIFGQKFPFEEFLFWFVILTIAILSYYEFFADDRK